MPDLITNLNPNPLLSPNHTAGEYHVRLTLENLESFIADCEKECPQARDFLMTLKTGIVKQLFELNRKTKIDYNDWLLMTKGFILMKLQEFKNENKIYQNSREETKNKTSQQAKKISTHDSKESLPPIAKRERVSTQLSSDKWY